MKMKRYLQWQLQRAEIKYTKLNNFTINISDFTFLYIPVAKNI